MNRISAIVCTYHGDDPDELEASIRSLLEQTRLPNEILIVEDGELPASIECKLDNFEESQPVPFRRVSHATNLGHGEARRTGIANAKYELVAIQDSDDLSVPKRLELTEKHLLEHDADVVGGYILEFHDKPENPLAIRKVPCEPNKIEQMAKFRNPMNHTTVLARRQSMLAVGNYRPMGQMEDYELWARMLARGFVLKNIPEVLAKVRTGKDMIRRRGGFHHMIEEYRLQKYLIESGFITRRTAAINFILRSIPKVIPAKLRSLAYNYLLRDSLDDTDGTR